MLWITILAENELRKIRKNWPIILKAKLFS